MFENDIETNTRKAVGKTASEQSASWLEVVRNHVNSLQYGVVQIVVHDSRVVQIERTEKVRMDRTQAPNS